MTTAAKSTIMYDEALCTSLKKAPRKDTPRKAKCVAKAAQARRGFGQQLIDPSVIEEDGFVESMAAFLRHTQVAEIAASYGCTTQPKAQPDQLYLGWDGRVGLWKNESVINFAAFAGGYPTKQHALYAAYRLNEAAQQWNSVELGVKFKWVDKLEDAEFVLAYGGDDGGTLARAFFPNTKDLNTVFVYKRAYDRDTVNFQANIFAHELGHVLGFRHEFAPQEGGAVLFGPQNPNSVMAYTFPPSIQPSDVASARLLYQALDGSRIEGFPVDRIEPDN